jgi:hypothetical protein
MQRTAFSLRKIRVSVWPVSNKITVYHGRYKMFEITGNGNGCAKIVKTPAFRTEENLTQIDKEELDHLTAQSLEYAFRQS